MSRLGLRVVGRSPLAALALLLTVPVVGCRSRRAEDFIPSASLSQAAVAAALDTWRSGGDKVPPIGIDENEVRVEWVDNVRAPGRKLAGYTILGETPATNARAFVVQLRLADPPEELKCRYLVVGIDPLWVFRQEDYDMLAHWDHVMPTEETADAPAPSEVTEQDP